MINIKVLKKIMQILAIIAICLISFLGIYVKESGIYKNIVKDYELSSDLTGYRELIFEISDATEVLDSEGKKVGNTDSVSEELISQNNYQKTENKINSDEDKNIDNFNKVKSIIEKRLRGLGTTDYNISINEETGKIFLRLAEDEETDHTIGNLLQVGKFQIKDSEDESKVLIEGKDLKKVSSVYNTTEKGTTVYLQIELDKEATNKFADITENEYKTIEKSQEEKNQENEEAQSTENEEKVDDNQNVENEEKKDEKKQKQIILAIDNNKLITTSFDDPIKDGIIDLSMGNSTKDADKISEYLKSTSTIAVMLNSGELPLTYKVVENKFVKQAIDEMCSKEAMYIAIAVIIALALVMQLKYKKRGFLGSVCFIGYIALYLLLIRYTNVSITLNSIVAIALMSGLSYLGIWNMLKINETDEEMKSKLYTKEYKSFISKIVPVAIIAFTFSFIKWEAISTFGMITFWGILLVLIYNLIITRKIID